MIQAKIKRVQTANNTEELQSYLDEGWVLIQPFLYQWVQETDAGYHYVDEPKFVVGHSNKLKKLPELVNQRVGVQKLIADICTPGLPVEKKQKAS
jgi:hypothetical protein